MALNKTQEVILAILSEAEEQGLRALTTTALVKFVYLVDYANAKETNGQTLTNSAWRFLHFGPFDAALPNELEVLVDRGYLSERTSDRADKDYYVFSLTEGVARRSLASIGLANRAITRVQQYLRKYSGDLNKLLNFVYYETEPMEEAPPNGALDFTLCRSDTFQETKPIPLNQLLKSSIEAYRVRLTELQAARLERPRVKWEGVYDEVYEQAMRWLDDEDRENGVGNSGILVP